MANSIKADNMTEHSSQHISARSDHHCTRQFRECTGHGSDDLQAQRKVVDGWSVDMQEKGFHGDFEGCLLAYGSWEEAKIVLDDMKASIKAGCRIPCQECVVSIMIWIFTFAMLTPQSEADTARPFKQPPSLNAEYTRRFGSGSGDGDQAQSQLPDGSDNTAQR